ncbi:MAG: hypothetical protein ACI83O_000232 [Patescibacteria group bacterium]|jgi:hypothetical protein
MTNETWGGYTLKQMHDMGLSRGISDQKLGAMERDLLKTPKLRTAGGAPYNGVIETSQVAGNETYNQALGPRIADAVALNGTIGRNRTQREVGNGIPKKDGETTQEYTSRVAGTYGL